VGEQNRAFQLREALQDGAHRWGNKLGAAPVTHRKTIRWEPAGSWLVRRTPRRRPPSASAQRHHQQGPPGRRARSDRQARTQHRQGDPLDRDAHAPAAGRRQPRRYSPGLDRIGTGRHQRSRNQPVEMPASRRTVGSGVSRRRGQARGGEVCAPATAQGPKIAATIASFTASTLGRPRPASRTAVGSAAGNR